MGEKILSYLYLNNIRQLIYGLQNLEVVTNKVKMDKPVFILGSHKSGTSLLRNLFDDVDGFFSIPIELHFFEFSGFWIDYALRRNPPTNLSFDEVEHRIESEIQQNQFPVNENIQYGGGFIHGNLWNREIFKSHMEKAGRQPYESKNYRRFFDVYIEALYLSIYGVLPSPAIRFVEKTVENAEFAVFLKKLYPDAKFIHIIRNPYAVLVSIRKYRMLNGHYPYLGTIMDALENSYYYASVNPLIIDDYLVIKYEDLLASTKKVMKKVASFLDVPFTESMLIPTSQGSNWKGNSMSGQAFDGISTKPISAWEKEIYPIEIEVINQIFPHILKKYGYEIKQNTKSPFIPAKNEGIFKYIINRSYWQTLRFHSKGDSST